MGLLTRSPLVVASKLALLLVVLCQADKNLPWSVASINEVRLGPALAVASEESSGLVGGSLKNEPKVILIEEDMLFVVTNRDSRKQLRGSQGTYQSFLRSRGFIASYAEPWTQDADGSYPVPWAFSTEDELRHAPETVMGTQQKQAVQLTMNWINRETNVHFRPKTSSDNYWVKMLDNGACQSFVGMTRFYYQQGQYLSLGLRCALHGTPIHELFHALGLHHEHTREDRDQHVIVTQSNHNYDIQPFHADPELRTDFDIFSVMNYSPANGVSPNQAHASLSIGNKAAPSSCDWATVGRFYPGTIPAAPCFPNTVRVKALEMDPGCESVYNTQWCNNLFKTDERSCLSWKACRWVGQGNIPPITNEAIIADCSDDDRSFGSK